MSDSYTDRNEEAEVETASGQHVNPDGETDAEKGARLGGLGGAVTGIVAGAMMGPTGALLGAVVGGVAGAVASGLAVAAVDTVDDDSKTLGTTEDDDRATDAQTHRVGGQDIDDEAEKRVR